MDSGLRRNDEGEISHKQETDPLSRRNERGLGPTKSRLST